MRSVQESFNRKLIYNPSARCICSQFLIIEAMLRIHGKVLRRGAEGSAAMFGGTDIRKSLDSSENGGFSVLN